MWKASEMRRAILGINLLGLLLLGGCADDPEAAATLSVKGYVEAELDTLHAASVALQRAAPEPDADGWNARDDAEAVASMRREWARARAAYERIEGAIAVLFPHLDVSTDERYDGFIELEADADLFDGEGATGMHAIERILWADAHPPNVVAFESLLVGYAPARFPETEAEARRFRDALVARLIEDIETMRTQFAPLALDPATAFGGVIGSMGEQVEKISLAATGEDESRYAQTTLADMRANLEGGRQIYLAFQPWVRAHGPEADDEVAAGFDRLDAAYGALSGDSLPPVPEGWNPDEPDPAHLDGAYGRLWQRVSAEADPDSPTSLVSAMRAAARVIDVPIAP